jgi:hypothetical protein
MSIPPISDEPKYTSEENISSSASRPISGAHESLAPTGDVIKYKPHRVFYFLVGFSLAFSCLAATLGMLHLRSIHDLEEKLSSMDQKQAKAIDENARLVQRIEESNAKLHQELKDRSTNENAKQLDGKIDQTNNLFKQTASDLSSKINEIISSNDPVTPDYTLGSIRLANMPAKSLLEKSPLSTALENQREDYLQRVGGIVFEQVASPQDGVPVGKLTLTYNPTAKDGSRFVVTLNDKALSLDIPDWQLLPIARFAATQNTACVTVLGDLGNEKLRDAILNKNGRVINYHPAFENCVLGLRLLQADILIVSANAAHLPKAKDTIGWAKPIYGTGEKAIAPQDGIIAFIELETDLQANNQLATDFRQYGTSLLCDYETPVTFREEKGKLQLTGEPLHYFFSGKKGGYARFPRLDSYYAERHQLIRRINPLVWDATLQTMRYAAFFRYCQKSNKAEWEKFLSQLPKESERSLLKTPSVLLGIDRQERVNE